ncbi:unnamed protein product [Oppiella nova]|uniref:Uncharacterized protein n=1 Tax=Oppiella nova TaxID=334625 RepID=A0A7R9LKX9_9ACAR|nr:unnamed protein product [Oppiella nova]CAG2164668.1 unnamed protein product [Oppiella nova]
MDETHTHFLYFVVLLLISIIDIETKQFCLSYVENYNEIDYGLRQIKDKNESNSFLFIDNHYWDLDFIDDSDDNKKTVNLWMTESRKSIHWFGGHYSMAFALWRPGTQRRSCVFALINGNKTLVDFRVRVGHIGREHKVKEYQKVIETPIEFIDLNPSIAFVPNREQYLGRLVVFVERKRLDPQKFQIISKVYEFDDNYIGTEVSNISQLNDTNPIALNDLDPELDVIAIMAQMDRSGVYGLIIVFSVI